MIHVVSVSTEQQLPGTGTRVVAGEERKLIIGTAVVMLS